MEKYTSQPVFFAPHRKILCQFGSSPLQSPLCWFLDVFTDLYKRLCLSVSLSVGNAFVDHWRECILCLCSARLGYLNHTQITFFYDVEKSLKCTCCNGYASGGIFAILTHCLNSKTHGNLWFIKKQKSSSTKLELNSLQKMKSRNF